MGKAAAASEPMTALRMELHAANVRLVCAMNHEFEQVELRAWLAMLAGTGIVLFTLYRWKGSLAARIALELAGPPEASGEPGNV